MGTGTVALDLITTSYALFHKPYLYETRLYGNLFYVEFPFVLFWVALLYALEKRFGYEKYHILSFSYACLPLIGVINNLFYMI